MARPLPKKRKRPELPTQVSEQDSSFVLRRGPTDIPKPTEAQLKKMREEERRRSGIARRVSV